MSLKKRLKVNKTKAPLKKLTKTYLETFDLIQEDKSIEEIAMIRDLGLSSVLSHLSVLNEHDKIVSSKKRGTLKTLGNATRNHSMGRIWFTSR